ncbi:hypothetical protein HMPREF1012_03882 [Bacillus sp. BT1B_CT2]|uniref:hypothetical protein n=1 Tax=Bacillus TaxID=1386 RepID=UPI0001F45791|nr:MULTISPECIES: hypothetical protein [Bacillus]EFV70094.1 hypothetical protein HMPREF1012_03882 [Bacillus sp. BT1B_CT2]MBS2764277.1 hypothetical protein [Bacillus licheniformis]
MEKQIEKSIEDAYIESKKNQELIRSRHMKRSLGSCSKFLDWAEKEGWSTEQIYYVARIVLALLERED